MVSTGQPTVRGSFENHPDDAEYDVFLSYAQADSELASSLAAALRDKGQRVWIDDRSVDNFTSISAAVVDGIRMSKVLVPIYSKAYPLRPACQWELTAAYIAAQRLGQPRDRILVVNPDQDPSHVQPVELRDAKYMLVAHDADLADMAAEIARRVSATDGPFGAPISESTPRWYPAPRADATDFVGRLPALWALHTALQAAKSPLVTGSSVAITHVRGLGGIGKSMLADEYARRFSAAYPGGICWLTMPSDMENATFNRAERDASRHRQLRSLAERLGVDTGGLTLDNVIGRLADALDEPGDSYLWVVDDVPVAISAPEVRDWFAPSGLGYTLLISRGPVAGVPLAIQLEPLGEDEAMTLLTGAHPPVGGDEHNAALDVVKVLGRHPQALAVAGTALQRRQGLAGYADMAAALANPTADELELAAELAGELPNGHEASIAATLSRSIDDLGRDGLDVLRVAACLGPDAVPIGVLSRIVQDAGGLSDLDAVHRVASGVNDAETHSLLRRTDDGDPIVHTLVSRVVRISDRGGERTARLRQAAVRIFDEELTGRMNQSRAYEIPVPLLSHARHLLHNPGERLELELLLKLGKADLDRGDAAAAEATYKRAYERSRLIWGDDDGLTIMALGNIAAATSAGGRVIEARRIQQQLLSSLTNKPKDGFQLTTALSNLGDSYRVLGDLVGARAIQEKVLHLAARLRLPEDVHIGFVANFALTLHELGEFPEAQRLGEEVVRRRLAAYGESHPDTHRAQNNLALTLQRVGRLDDARQLAEAAAEGWSKILGPSHTDTLLAWHNASLILVDLGELSEARNLQEQVVRAAAEHLRDDHHLTGIYTQSLGVTLLRLGQDAEAVVVLRRAAEILERVLGAENPRTLDAVDVLSTALRSAEKWADAAELRADVLHRSIRTFGQADDRTIERLEALAESCLDLGDFRAAAPLLERVGAIYRSKYTVEDRRTQRVLERLAAAQAESGELEKSVATLDELASVAERVNGLDDEWTLLVLNQLGVARLANGEAKLATGILDRALEASRRVRDSDAPATLTLMANLGSAFHRLRNFDAARVLEEHVVAVREATLGDAHPMTITSRYWLSETLHDSGDAARARELLEHLVPDSFRVLGSDSSISRWALARLLETLRMGGDDTRAREVEARYEDDC